MFWVLYHDLLRKELLAIINSTNEKQIQNIFALTNEFAWLIALILQRLPNSAWYTQKWMEKLTFLKYPWTQIANAELCSSNTFQ